LDVEDASDDVPDVPRDAPMEVDMSLMQSNGYAGAGSASAESKHSVRAAILDLLLDNLAPQVVAPSIAHLLLGYDVQRSLARSVLRNPKTDGTVPLNALHVVVKLIQRGTEETADDGPASLNQKFWIRHSNLAEKCYHLIYVLCADPQTSTATLQYLRGDNFLARQLAILPSADLLRQQAADDMEEIPVEIAEADITLCRAWLLRTVALELRRLSLASDGPVLSKLLKVLYASEVEQTNGGSRQRNTGPARMLDVAMALDTSSIELANLPRGSRITEGDLGAYLYEDSRGCMVYDVQTLASAVSLSLRRPDERLSGGTFQDREIYQLYQVLVVRNRQHEAHFARRQCMKAWAEIVEVSLSEECYAKVPVGDKHILLYDMCTAILPRLADEGTDVDMAGDLSGAVLGMIAKLGAKDSSDRAGPGGAPSSALSLDMLATLLKEIISLLTRPGIKPATQGDLANAFLRFVQDVAINAGDARGSSGGSKMDAADLEEEPAPRASSAVSVRQTGTLATIFRLVDQSYDRLVSLLSSMALDAPEDVWKATALAGLDAILALYQLQQGSKTERVVDFLNRRNFLGALVTTVRGGDRALQQLIHTYEAGLLIFELVAFPFVWLTYLSDRSM
jgi:hypothetical protein